MTAGLRDRQKLATLVSDQVLLDFNDQNLFQYKIGIGICKGEMFAGYVGNTNSRLDYAILGDAIKTAGKLESASVQNPDYPLTVCRNTALDLREKNVKFLNVAGIDGFFIDKTEKHNIKDTISDENGGLKQTFSTNSENIEKTIISSNYSNKKSAQEDALGTTPNEAATTECALMYIGIPNFTGITSSNTPHDAFEMLKNQIGILADLTIQEGGEVDKIIGEKMLSVFYKTSDDTNPVSNACNVAIKIKDARQNNILPMNYAIGINYGKVITGFLGAGGKRDHTVIGDAVNTAARIESYAELKAQNSLCLMSEIAAQQLLHDSYKLKKLDAVSLKGKENKIVVYEIC